MTITEILTEMKKNTMTAEDGAKLLGPTSYGMKFGYNCTADEAPAYRLLRKAWTTMCENIEVEKKAAVTSDTEVLCECGHRVENYLVMHTSTGTACYDCYDEMSV